METLASLRNAIRQQLYMMSERKRIKRNLKVNIILFTHRVPFAKNSLKRFSILVTQVKCAGPYWVRLHQAGNIIWQEFKDSSQCHIECEHMACILNHLIAETLRETGLKNIDVRFQATYV